MQSPTAEPLLRISGLGKRYTAPVLSEVELAVHSGEVHALMGANGAGKSTLARIVAGLVAPDAGTMRLAGAPYAPAGKADAERAGVRIVQQELNLLGTLSVAENLFLSRLPRRLGLVDRRRLHREAEAALATVGLERLDPRTPVAELGVGVQQLVEIAAALARPCRVLILDEPTAALTDPEIETLFANLERLRAAGVAIVYVSHRTQEIRRMADRVTVLRDGRVVATQPAAELTVERAVRLMVGAEAEQAMHPRERRPGPVLLRVEGLRRGDRVRSVSFQARAGEILGIAGLVGSGRTELLRAVFGADRPEGGRVMLGEGPAPLRIREPRDAVRAGIAMLPEDRKEHGLLLEQPVRVNMTLARLGAVSARSGWIDAAREREAAERLRALLDVRCASLEQPVGELSGGNQQKVVIARWLMRDCRVLLFDEPTRGIDVGAKRAVYRLLDQLAAEGRAVVVVSSELEELTALCDRIAVMSDGWLVRTFVRGEWTHDLILAAAVGGHPEIPTHPSAPR